MQRLDIGVMVHSCMQPLFPKTVNATPLLTNKAEMIATELGNN